MVSDASDIRKKRGLHPTPSSETYKVIKKPYIMEMQSFECYMVPFIINCWNYGYLPQLHYVWLPLLFTHMWNDVSVYGYY